MKNRWSKRSVIFVSLLLVFVLMACENTTKPTQEDHANLPTTDVVIIGSEIEGVYLARAAKDEGLSVTILDPREHLGGQLIQGQMLYLDEPFDDQGKSLLQGRVKHLFDEYKKGTIRKSADFQKYYESLLEGIQVESGIRVTDIEIDSIKSPKQVKSIAYETVSGEKKHITASYFVENTDFAALTSQLGVEQIPGIETFFGSKNKEHMAATYMMKFKNVNWEQFDKQVNALSKEKRDEKYGGNTNVSHTFTYGFGNIGRSYKPTNEKVYLRGLNTINMLNGEAAINALLVFGVNPSDPASIKDSVELGQSESEHVVKHLRETLPGWEKAELNEATPYLYIRDSDRYETNYVLQASDLMSGTMHWDDVSIAGYSIDLQGIQSQVWGKTIAKPDKYGMPLRSFMTKGYSNVIVAGKNVGASAIAFGSARIQPNTSLAGETIGYILGQIKGKKNLVDLKEQDFEKLTDYISQKYNITLKGVPANNKIKDYTPEQIEKLNIKGSIVGK
ncbi:FAD-dependent oxidoreductase [Paenibacillus sp. N1-5-1-14]|uniref:FAD-dependent oxidoreductase n=1 Tax=Paenibacillus radicibacter TaxID=2972488 RepID=UPI0021599AF9|nr:FAD-dependent oxidoreductase [Paenibacillus radicibacter]MCR8643081.1 FAD-dependent oxidoreductase [Paenibacillus radicibacter]